MIQKQQNQPTQTNQPQQSLKRQYPPKQTLYLQNLNQKINSKDLKYVLYTLFSSYGEIAQLICKKNNKMRGQAFVVFRDVAEATMAKNNLDGFIIFQKPMKVKYAAKRSKIFSFNVKE